MGGRGAGEERQGFSDTPFHCLRCVGGWGVQVVIYPCDADGTLHDVNNVYDDPNALLGQPLSFKFSLRGATLHKTKYAGGIEVQFTHKYCEDGRIFKTATAQGTNHPTWDFEHVFTIPKVDEAILQWLQEGALRAFVYVWQTDEVADDASLSVGATPHAHTQGPVALHAGKSTAQLIQDLQTSKQAADAGHSEALAQLDGYVCLVYRTVYLRYVRVCVCVDTLICKGVYVCVCICV
eukprot:m.780189 g.780189  ORF g.780189 m.780189 type:complete len:236 (-) comp23280_c2_seq16:243-950(-)